ncbi:MFS transporter [Thermodesulfovibrionales bacterium]|nr:MFS transporter [Thermodesulfovibrionales bacterium]MCL0051517.1 MFS transporter [Thermodesulfovibrionales bacterium]
MITEKKDDAVTKQDAAKNLALLKGDSSNYKTIFIANVLLSFTEGLYYPFLIVFLYHLGGMPLIGSGLGLILISESIGSYLAGRGADRYGRKPFLLISSIVSVAVFISYPLLPLLETPGLVFVVLFLIFFVDGIIGGFWNIAEAAYLADITSKATRGSRMGSYWGAGGVVFGVAMIAAGFLGLHIDFLTVALIVAFIYLSGVFLLLSIKEVAGR